MDVTLRPLTDADVDAVVAFSLDAWAPVFASMETLTKGGEPASFERGPLVEKAAAVLGRYWELS